MNSKKSKNKNRPNKPPNPNPPQKIEEVISTDKEEVQQITETVESAPKIEERVPEIISEIVALPVFDSEEKNDETPKKPKRNRGKKKNQDTDSQKTTVESDNVRPEGLSDIPNITPSAPKKKNKDKKTSELSNKEAEKNYDQKNTLKEETIIAPISEPLEQEVKPPKKKNKKKKHRTDSEKSEKAEEVSCITAFQKLLKDDKSEKTEEDIDLTICEAESTKANENINDMKKVTMPEVNALITENIKKEEVADLSKQIVADNTKGKKKNKRDKKNPPKEEIKESLYDVTPEMKIKVNTENILEQTSVSLDSTDVKQEIIMSESKPQSILPQNLITLDGNFQSEEKVAKPVERKQKEKESDLAKDTLLETIIQDYDSLVTDREKQDITGSIECEKIAGKVKSDGKQDDESNKKDMKQLQDICQFEESPKITITKMDVNYKEENDITLESDYDLVKKRKKSPKPKQHSQAVDLNLIQVQASENVETQTEKNIPEIEMIIEEKKPEELEPTVKTEVFDKKEGTKVVDKSKQDEKKSPKLPMENKTTNKDQNCDSESNKQSFIKESEDTDKDKTEIFCNISTLDDIEIRSLKAEESEESTCDTVPDIIQYPRATSQDIIDVNNNVMSIQEITFTEETKLRIPVESLETPLISGSGETPLGTPEIAIIGNISQEEIKIEMGQPSDSGKTDLKSKMMEVNQDMEELRLSIEKSLAELTNLEKSEEEIEKAFTDKMLSITEEAQPMELKQHMPCEDVAQSPPEKENISLQADSKSEICKNEPITVNEFLENADTQSDTKDIEVKTVTKSTVLAATELVVDPSKLTEMGTELAAPPACPVRKENKNKKGKSKKKGNQVAVLSPVSSESISTASEYSKHDKTTEKKEKSEYKHDSSTEQGKKQCELATNDDEISKSKQELNQEVSEFQPIETFEDAMTSSADDINKSFEMIANEASQVEASLVNPEINIIAPMEDIEQEKRDKKVNPVSQPKNLLGHSDIPVPSNRMDYKKEKNKSPNEALAKVKIKDSIAVETKRRSKESQTDNIRKFIKNKSIQESFSVVNENEDFVYKYSFRKVFLQSSCHVCKKDLKQSRVPCNYCSLVFYCSGKHKDEDWPQHQALCFAVSTIGHLKDQKHIYADAKGITGQNYRLLRMQMIVSCEKVLKRRLVPWEQEALLYPRICADLGCREWRQSKLVDCDGCHQISYCSAYSEHMPKSHQRWCKSYSLYQKLVSYQQTKGRLEPKLPSKVLIDYQIPEKMNEVLASMYEEKIDMSDIQYAALTQIATAPLTAAYCCQIASKNQPLANIICKKSICTIHVVDAELQFEADALNKWEVFFLHLTPVDELRVVMISSNLNPGNLPLELLSRIKLCENCRLHERRVIFNFYDKKTYYEYWANEDYITPDIVCAFNANISRSSMYNTKDPWPKTLNCILKQKVPFLITAHTLNEIQKDMYRVKECAEQQFNVIVEPKINNFASVRPDRNFITDDEMPLLFKNYGYMLLIGA